MDKNKEGVDTLETRKRDFQCELGETEKINNARK